MVHAWLVQVVPSMMSDLEDVYLSVVAAVRDMVRVASTALPCRAIT